jgi:hypothetical protein
MLVLNSFTDFTNQGDNFRINVMNHLTDNTMLRSTSIVGIFLLQYWSIISHSILFYSSTGMVFFRTEPMKWMEVWLHPSSFTLPIILTQQRRCFCQPVPDLGEPLVSI